MFNDVIVPLDGSAEAARALGPACAMARYTESEVRAVAFFVDGNREELAVKIEEQMRGFGGVSRSLLLEPLLYPVGEHLARLMWDSPGSLVCMTTRGRGRSAAVLGSASSAVLKVASSPVMLVGPSYQASSFRCHGPLVVAVDETEHSLAAVPVAEAFAVVFDYDLEVVTVTEKAPPTAQASRRSAGNVAIAAERDIEAPVGFTQLTHNDPAAAIVNHAKHTNAALLAMSTHNPSGLRRLLVGSTTAAVVQDATCPVLAIRPPAPPAH